MLTTESTLVRAFTKRRANTVNVVAPPPATQEAVQRRQAALRQMGLLPALSLSQQEAQLDKLIPPTSPVDQPTLDSEADRIKNEWVTKNNLASFKFGGTSLPPSPPLTPRSAEFVGDAPTTTDTLPEPEAEPTIESTVIESATSTSMSITTTDSHPDSSAPLTPHSDTPSISALNESTALILNLPPSAPLNFILEDQEPCSQECQPQLTQSPISDEFHPPESPSHLHPHHPSRSRSPSLAPSESKSTRSRSKSRTRARSPLRFLAREQPLPDPKPETETPAQPQRKKTVFARFKRSNTVDPSSVSSPQSRQKPQGQPPSRSKSLFTSVKKTVFGGLTANNANNPSTGDGDGDGGVVEECMDALPSTLPTVSNESTPLTTAPADPDSSQPDVVVVEQNPGAQEPEPAVSFRPSADMRPDGLLLEFPLLDKSEEGHESPSSTTSPGKGIGKGIGIGLSLILNRERTKSASPSTPPASPLAPSFLSSPPASPTVSTGLLRGRLGRKGTIGAGSESLLSVWGGVTGLLGSASSVNSGEGGGMEGRQALAPTIHNQASILHHMSNIEDEETRRVTELAFM